MTAQADIRKLKLAVAEAIVQIRKQNAGAKTEAETDAEIVAALTKVCTPEQLRALWQESVEDNTSTLEGAVTKALLRKPAANDIGGRAVPAFFTKAVLEAPRVEKSAPAPGSLTTNHHQDRIAKLRQELKDKGEA